MQRAGSSVVWLVGWVALILAASMPHGWTQEKSLKGVALVIAGSDYQNLPDLPNTANDAREVQKLLADLGFEVQTVNDGDRKRLSRQLQRFVEDAEEADVALLYYSGHGIEAGGENYLVPVDADIAAVDAADKHLVSLAEAMETLRETVPISIVLLDACRTNPFPPGAMLRRAAGEEGQPVTAAGLGQPRSVTAFGGRSAPAGEETFGSVIGYSAEPGQVALDGEPGGNSPYAEALIRHLSAMQGEEFGMVLRMVAEEVYLRTRGAQRPWVNESLRRLLYLGGDAEEPQGAEGDILRERRKLLVKISTLPDRARKEVEAISATDSVPMDAVFAMLAALGENAPADPAELDRMLRAQAEKLKAMRAERDAVTTSDPEIRRLTDLANSAVDEGAISAAITLHEQIKNRIGELSSRIDAVEENLKARRLEFAAAYARSAETLNLSFDYLGAARDFHSAFEEVKRWDSAKAWQYRLNEGLAYWNHGDQRGDSNSIRTAIETYRDALNYETDDPGDHPLTLNNIGVALTELGTRLGNRAMLDDAAAAHRKALEVYTREYDPGQWAWTQSLLANALLMASEHHSDQALFVEAIAAYQAALEVRKRETTPLDWARVHQNMGIAQLALARRDESTDTADEAIASFRRALEEFTRDRAPDEWMNTQTNLAAAMRFRASLTKDTEMLREAGAAYREVLDAVDRSAYPLQWANAYNNLANVFRDYGLQTKDASFLEAALKIHDEVLKVISRDDVPLAWAQSHGNKGATLRDLAAMKDEDPALLEASAAAYRMSLTAYTRETAPSDWAAITISLAQVLDSLGEKTGNESYREEAGKAYRDALTGYDRTRSPAAWAYARDQLARFEYDRGWKSGSAELLRSAVDGYREANAASDRGRSAVTDADNAYNIGLAYLELAKLTSSPDDRRASVAAFREALRGYGAAGRSLDVARSNYYAGGQLLELAMAEGGLQDARDAAKAFRLALEIAPADITDPDQPTVWNELGRATQHIADLEGVSDGLPDAIAAFIKASDGFAKAGSILDAAISRQNAGLAALSLGQRTTGGGERFDDAITHLKQAAADFTQAGDKALAHQATFNLGRAMDAKAVATSDPTLLDAAIDIYVSSLGGWPAEGDRTDWAFNQSLLGQALQTRALSKTAKPGDFAASVDAFSAAESAYPEATSPVDFAAMRNSVAFARILEAESSRSSATFELAVADARKALSVQLGSGDEGNLPYIRDTLCRALAGLGEERRDREAIAEAIANCESAVADFKAANQPDLVAESQANLDRARKALTALP